jgi:hypothetical protein
MKHIPHITISTNMEKIDSSVLSRDIYIVNEFSEFKTFPKMYKNDHLNACGFYCKLDCLKTDHIPHMSLFYNEKTINTFVPPESLKCMLYIANTESLNCSDWYLL